MNNKVDDYKAYVDMFPSPSISEMEEWMVTNYPLEDYNYLGSGKNSMISFYFTDEDIAAHFKLVWSE